MPELNIYSGGRWVAVSGGAADASVVHHDGPLPEPQAPTPKALEDAFAAYEDGLHYFKDAGTIVTIVRREYQTIITLTGPVDSVASIAKSEAGLPTPENPSTILQRTADGKCMKVSSDDYNAPFGRPEVSDAFDVPGSLFDKDIRLGKVMLKSATFQDAYTFSVDNVGIGVRPLIEYSNQGQTSRIVMPSQDDVYLKAEADSRFLNQQYFLDNAFCGPNIIFKDTNGSIYWKTPNLGDGKGPDAVLSVALWTSSPSLPAVPRLYFDADGDAGGYLAYTDEHYTKKEVDDKIEDEKDFSIANDNLIMAELTALQDTVANLGTDIGTGQIDVLAAIEGAAIEPAYIKFPEAELSPIQWKGGLALAPLKTTDGYTLQWNSGKGVETVCTDATFEGWLSQTQPSFVTVSILGQQFKLGPAEIGVYGGKIMYDAGQGSQTLATLSDLSSYAKLNDPNQIVFAKAVSADAFTFGTTAGLRFMDTGEGYGTRLVFAYPKDGQEKVELIPYRSDFDEVNQRLQALESKQAPVAADLTGMATQPALDFQAKRVDAVITEVGVMANEIATLKAATPTASANLDDPALADFKKSILDAVATMLAGDGKKPPADIGWTPCRTADGKADSVIQVRMIAGVMEFKGVLSTGSISGSRDIFQIPASFPLPELSASYPIAARMVSVNAIYAYVSFNSNSRTVTVTMNAQLNEVTLTGVRTRAAY